MTRGKPRQVIEKIGGASRDRTDDLIVANDALSQNTSNWRALGSRLRSKTVQVPTGSPVGCLNNFPGLHS